MKHVCKKCGYETNRLWSFNDHNSRSSACEKRLKRIQCSDFSISCSPNVVPGPISCSPNVVPCSPNVVPCRYNEKTCFNSNINNQSVDILQCPTCKKTFSCRQNKHRHVKRSSCESVSTEDQKKIKQLEEQLEEKDKQLEVERSKKNIQNITIHNNTYNHFNPNIKYNNYDNLDTSHITQEVMEQLYLENGKRFGDTFEETCRMILVIDENKSFVLPEGGKSNRCIVIKDGKELLKMVESAVMKLSAQAGKKMRMVRRVKNDEYNMEFLARAFDTSNMDTYETFELNEDNKELIPRAKNVMLEQQWKH